MKTHLTMEDIKSKIKSEQYQVFPESMLTICLLTLENGWSVTGESACADPVNFDAEKGRMYAYTQAVENIWEFEGYLLKQRLFEAGLI